MRSSTLFPFHLPSRIGRSAGMYLTLCLLVLSSLTLALAPQVAHAKSVSQRGYQQGPEALMQFTTRSGGKQIDWAHPYHVLKLPASVHSGRGADLPPHTVPLPSPSGAGQSGVGPMMAGPLANWPSCYGSAYPVEEDGSVEWINTIANIGATVQYYWCARWPGDGIGINWAYGTVSINGSGACGYVTVGNGWGAAIYSLSQEYLDGENTTTYWVCNSYVWDDSVTVYGGGIYVVRMSASVNFGEITPIVNSPEWA